MLCHNMYRYLDMKLPISAYKILVESQKFYHNKP